MNPLRLDAVDPDSNDEEDRSGEWAYLVKTGVGKESECGSPPDINSIVAIGCEATEGV